MWVTKLLLTAVSVVAGQQQQHHQLMPAYNNNHHLGAGAGIMPLRQNCPDMCNQYYGANHNPYYEQINDYWSSCVEGCHHYSMHEEMLGNDPINVLNSCNYSCDERYYEKIGQSCKAGCSFNYDAAVAANQDMQQELQHLQAAPRASRMEEIELPAETEAPPPQQPLPPIVQILNRVMPRINNLMQQTFARQFEQEQQRPQEPQQHIIQEEHESRPLLRSFIIPIENPGELFGRKQSEDPSPVFSQLFETANNLMQSMPEFPRMSMNPWSEFPGMLGAMNNGGSERHGELIISRSGPGYQETKHYNLENGQLIEIEEEATMGNDALAHVNPMDTDFNESDVELIEPFVQHQQQVVPALEAEEHMVSEQPAFVIDPYSIPSEQYVQDPYTVQEQEQLVDEPFIHMSFPQQEHSNNVQDNEIVQASPEFPQPLRQDPPMEDRAEQAVVKEDLSNHIVEEVKNSHAHEEFPSVHREFVVELDSSDIKSLKERLMAWLHWRSEQENAYLAPRSDYRDVSCNSESLPLKDWLACTHLNVGMPRWLTAATIALGIIFSVWLCLVIPSAAPKQKIKSLVIRTQKLSKPSDAAASGELTAAEAKELEAVTASKEPVIAVIKVDLPPNYREVTPESPAPSYKSDMTPGSPAPSYKSIDTPLRTPEKKLEPVHGNESIA
eukprot:TRINITY_DN1972_c0_g1_i5.p1 TRINITY_DN1972_c0_g1~~TRINITY_DN1972_c0_g1_i5.p1  ORF type:complete len:669 (-),score=235.64 TRINITY_DN1972_c0_g1_i5:725-2731(-)